MKYTEFILDINRVEGKEGSSLAHWVKILVAKSDNLSLIPRNPVKVEGETRPPYVCPGMCILTHTSNKIITNQVLKGEYKMKSLSLFDLT